MEERQESDGVDSAPEPGGPGGPGAPGEGAEAAGRGPSILDRRGFLRGVAGGGAALALAGWLPAGGSSYPAQEGLRALSAKEHAIARAAAEALLPGVPVDPGSVADEIDRELALMGEPILSDVRAVLGLVEHLTLLGGRLRRFTALGPQARLDYLNGWATSRFNLRRAAFQAIRSLVHFVAWARPDTRPLTGYRGTWPENFDYPVYPVDFGEVR